MQCLDVIKIGIQWDDARRGHGYQEWTHSYRTGSQTEGTVCILTMWRNNKCLETITVIVDIVGNLENIVTCYVNVYLQLLFNNQWKQLYINIWFMFFGLTKTYPLKSTVWMRNGASKTWPTHGPLRSATTCIVQKVNSCERSSISKGSYSEIKISPAEIYQTSPELPSQWSS